MKKGGSLTEREHKQENSDGCQKNNPSESYVSQTVFEEYANNVLTITCRRETCLNSP